MTQYLPVTLNLRSLRKQLTDMGILFNTLFQWFKTKWTWFLLNGIAPLSVSVENKHFFGEGWVLMVLGTLQSS